MKLFGLKGKLKKGDKIKIDGFLSTILGVDIYGIKYLESGSGSELFCNWDVDIQCELIESWANNEGAGLFIDKVDKDRNIGKTVVFTKEMAYEQNRLCSERTCQWNNRAWDVYIGKIVKLSSYPDHCGLYYLDCSTWVYREVIDNFIDNDYVGMRIAITKELADRQNELFDKRCERITDDWNKYVGITQTIEMCNNNKSNGFPQYAIGAAWWFKDLVDQYIEEQCGKHGTLGEPGIMGLKTEVIFKDEISKPNLFFNHKLMKNVVQFGRDLFMSKESKLLREFGMENPENVPTEEGKELLMDILWRENRDKVIDIAKKMEEDEKAKK